MIIKPSTLELLIYSNRGLLEFYKKIPLRSFVRQFVDIKWSQWANQAVSIRDITNTLRTNGAGTVYSINSAAGQAYGIVVGTGTNAVTISDYKLQSIIAHGNGAGQLYHQATVVSGVTVSGSDAYFTAQRTFNNNSGGLITVQEAGIYSYSSTGYYFLEVRDLTGAIDIENLKSLVALYTFKVTV